MLLAIEGIDGAGKGTLTRALLARAAAAGVSAASLAFPRYGETGFARLVADYLNGRFGRLDQVSVHFAATLYAGDRLESLPRLRALVAGHRLVVLDRYVASNAAYNAAKLPPADRPTFLDWLYEMEHDYLALPLADTTCLLRTPPAVAGELVGRKGARDYTSAKADLHEKDRRYLERVAEVYEALAGEQRRSRWLVLDSIGSHGLRAPEAIADDLWRRLQPFG